MSCDIDYNLSSLTQGSPQRRKDKIIFLFTLVLLIRRYNETFVCCRYLTLFVVTGKCLLLKAVFDVRSTGDVMMLINDSKYHQKVSTLVPFIRNWLQCLCEGRLSLSSVTLHLLQPLQWWERFPDTIKLMLDLSKWTLPSVSNDIWHQTFRDELEWDHTWTCRCCRLHLEVNYRVAALFGRNLIIICTLAYSLYAEKL